MHYEFNPTLKVPLSLVNPLQLSAVKELLSRPIPDEVLGIVLFGSSLTLYCDLYSDLDLVFVVEDSSNEELSRKIYKAFRKLGKPADILIMDKDDLTDPPRGSVEYEVLKNGVIVYAKGKNLTA
ncbi:MAG: nucleotidyltransferase domain-containing protein [Clostridiales bacterium]|jgi:predicted nucleotidyltransferase|nr:nucleotidyltransferase domain-containing protein [Clostridiales bacterium]